MGSEDLNFPILVHMNKDEISELSRAQGGVDTDNSLGIPQFFKLGQMLEDPEVKGFITEAFEGYLGASDEHKARVEEDVEHYNDEVLGDEPSGEEIDAVTSPGAKALGELGIDGDTEEAILPKNLFDFMWDLLPESERKVNPNTGFPMFGFWSTLGSALTGIIGAGLASAAVIASGGALLPAVAATVAGGLGGYAAGERLWGDKGDSSSKQNQVLRSETVPLNFSNRMGGNGSQNTPYNAAQRADMISSGRPTNPMLPKDLSSLTSIDPYLQPHLYDQIQREHQLDIMDHYMDKNHARQDLIDRKRKYEFEVARARKGGDGALNSGYVNPIPLKTGGEVRYMAKITTNKYISGDEPGQLDNIMTDVPVGARIFDARTVSDTGDGNSLAGKNILLDYFAQFPVKKIHKYTFAPCALSAGEVAIMPDYIMAYGHGDLAEGHKKCDTFVEDLRKYKATNVNSIPKPLESISKLMR